MAKGCGCKICVNDLGEEVNEMLITSSPKEVLDFLELKGVKVTFKLLEKHANVFGITFSQTDEKEELTKLDINAIEFSDYDFDLEDFESVVGYIQQIQLKIYLNQAAITLEAQEKYLSGSKSFVRLPKELLQNLSIAYQLLERSTGMNIHVNQQQALRVVESMGLITKNIQNVQSITDPQTDE